MKSAYIVQGIGESTGCRFMTDILIKCGCYGTSEHQQEFDKYIHDANGFINQLKSKNVDKFVCRFSYPHGVYLPNVEYWYNVLKRSGYNKVYVILTTRSWVCQHEGIDAAKHLVNNKINKFETISDRIEYAYKNVFSTLNKIENGNYKDFVVVNLGDIIMYPEGNLKFILDKINLNLPEKFDFGFIKKDADESRINDFMNRINYIKTR